MRTNDIPMSKVLQRLINGWMTPLERYPLIIFLLTLLLFLPNLFSSLSIESLLLGLTQDFALTYLMVGGCCLMGNFFPKYEKLFVVALYGLIDVVAFFTAYIIFSSGTRLFSELLLVVYETSVEEALNFLSFYRYEVLLLTMGVIAIIILEIKLFPKNKSFSDRVKSWSEKKRGIIALVFLLSCTTLPIVGEGTLGNAKHQLGSFVSYLKKVKYVHAANVNLKNDHCTYLSSNIVLIIGESFNRNHSSLYGYPLPTNPKLSLRKNLYVFDDVIAPVNYTIGAFNNFLSLASVDDEHEWCDQPLFPCLFRAADYHVVLWDNQSGSCSYAFTGNIDFCSEKNKMQYPLDDELINDYKRNRAKVEHAEHNLIIFHLCGQHFDYQNKCTDEMRRFSVKDYDRKELSESEIQIIADYDNATLFNDSIVDEIIRLYEEQDAIILYFSDHGEEVYDYRHASGRYPFDMDNLNAWMKNQVEVPFMFYLTDRYKESHLEIVERIERSLHRPYMTDDLPHLLFDLAGITNQWYDPKRSVINDSFNVQRKRFVTEWSQEKKEYIGKQ